MQQCQHEMGRDSVDLDEAASPDRRMTLEDADSPSSAEVLSAIARAHRAANLERKFSQDLRYEGGTCSMHERQAVERERELRRRARSVWYVQVREKKKLSLFIR